MCLSRNTSRPTQQRYINPEARNAYNRQHQILLAVSECFSLPKEDEEAFAFMERQLLNITVEEAHKRREEDEDRISRYNQIFEVSNLPRPELKLKVTDTGYSSLYNYQSLSA